jgi:hypothetical protein
MTAAMLLAAIGTIGTIGTIGVIVVAVSGSPWPPGSTPRHGAPSSTRSTSST